MMIEVTIFRSLKMILSHIDKNRETARIRRGHLDSARLTGQTLQKPALAVFPTGIEAVEPDVGARSLGTWINCVCEVERDTFCYCSTDRCEYGASEGSQ